MGTSVTLVIDSPSPLIAYSPGDWTPIDSRDSELSRYNDSTALTSFGAGVPLAQYSFVGTGVQVFGAKRDNHGLYTVTLDGNAAITLDGRADVDAENQVLFSASNLTQGAHTLQIVNAGNVDGSNAFLDIDQILWESVMPDNTTSAFIDNTDPAYFTYLPSESSWAAEVDSSSFNASLAAASEADSQVRLDFVGHAVALYGALGPNNGNYTCAVDGNPPQIYSGTYPAVTTRQLLCFSESLGPGSHSLVLSNVPSGTNAALSIDYAEIWSVSDNTTSESSPSPIIPAAPSGSLSRTSMTGVIIAVVIGTLVLLALMSVALFLYGRRKRWFRLRRRRPEFGVSSILTQGPGAEKPDDIAVIPSGLPPEHLTPFVVRPTFPGPGPSSSGEYASQSQSQSGVMYTTTQESHWDRRSRSSSGSTGRTMSNDTHSSEEPPPLPVMAYAPGPGRAKKMLPLRVVTSGLDEMAAGHRPTPVVASTRPRVKALPTPPPGAIQRNTSIGGAMVVQEMDGGAYRSRASQIAITIPPAYTHIRYGQESV